MHKKHTLTNFSSHLNFQDQEDEQEQKAFASSRRSDARVE
jgi:hypothetical protein